MSNIKINIFESIYENGKMNYKIWWYWNSKTKILPAWRTHFDRHINTDKTEVSIKASFGKQVFKFFIGYKDAKKIKPLCIFLPKMIAYRKDFDETKYIYVFW